MPEVTPKLSKKHPVPQHIGAFEFKLIGDLTLKQFLYAGVGVAIAYAAFLSQINFLLKWLIIFLSAGLGLGIAFFPIQDRGLDEWLLNYLLAIFSPTQMVWRKQPHPPQYLQKDYSQFLTSQVLSLTPLQNRRRLARYLKRMEKAKEKSADSEQQFIEKLNFNLPLPRTAQPPSAPPPPPEKKLPQRKKLSPLTKLASEVNIALKPPLKIPTEGETQYFTPLRNIRPGRKVRIPTIEGVVTLKPRKKEEPPKVAAPPPPRPTKPPSTKLVSRIRPPRIPNVVCGVVKDRNGKLLENAIVIVKDAEGDPVRALKTNELGEFFISTPLENGRYTIEVSAEGKNFDIIKITADGRVLEPLELREKNGQNSRFDTTTS